MSHFRVLPEFTQCHVVVTPGRYDYKPFALGYQLNSPYAELFNYHINLMRESGVLDSITDKYRGRPQICPNYR